MRNVTIGLGDLPTWLAAVGTIAAVITALWQVASERRIRQTADDEARQERRHSQARLVSSMPGPVNRSDTTWSPSGTSSVDCINTSAEPVYNVIVGIVFLQGTGPRRIEDMLTSPSSAPPPVTTLSLLAPGRWRAIIQGSGFTSALAGRAGTEIAFTDRAGAHWIRRASGVLDSIDEDPLTYFARFNLSGPYDFQTPEPMS